ncbi:MAG TPA: hypothetical protein VE224_17505 [Pseudolabrys sp.]|nr:hypothetical protein [Pseudolabrys sp.]
MFSWLDNSYPWLSLLLNAAMLVVWIAYLQTIVSGYRRQRRAKIVINQGAGSSVDATCFISNMSQESIYVESVVMRVNAGGKHWECAVTDVERLDGEEESSDPRQNTLQGPLRPGDFMPIGSFRRLAERVLRVRRDGSNSVENLQDPIELELQVFADYASEDLLVSAKRRFEIRRRDGALCLHAPTLATEQIRSLRARKQIMAAMRKG